MTNLNRITIHCQVPADLPITMLPPVSDPPFVSEPPCEGTLSLDSTRASINDFQCQCQYAMTTTHINVTNISNCTSSRQVGPKWQISESDSCPLTYSHLNYSSPLLDSLLPRFPLLSRALSFRQTGDWKQLSRYFDHCRGTCSPCHYHARSRKPPNTVNGSSSSSNSNCRLGDACQFCHFCSQARARSYDQFSSFASSKDPRKRGKCCLKAVIIDREQCEYADLMKIGKEVLMGVFGVGEGEL